MRTRLQYTLSSKVLAIFSLDFALHCLISCASTSHARGGDPRQILDVGQRPSLDWAEAALLGLAFNPEFNRSNPPIGTSTPLFDCLAFGGFDGPC